MALLTQYLLILKYSLNFVKIVFFVFVLEIAFVCSCLGQESFFTYVLDSNNSQEYIAINFIDTNSREIISTFDLVENNPFNKLNYPELAKNNINSQNKKYDLVGIPLKEIEIDGCNIILRKGEELTTSYNDLVGYNFYYASVNGNNLVVHYLFYLYLEETVIGRGDLILIFDSVGNILHKIQDFDTNVIEWGLTDNARYFSYGYGGVVDESLEPFSTVGYKVIDLEENKTVVQEDFGYKFNEVRTGAFKNIITVAGFSLDYYYIFIDFAKKRKYKRILTNIELGLWKELTDEGLILYKNNRESNSITYLKFDTDFEVEKIF